MKKVDREGNTDNAGDNREIKGNVVDKEKEEEIYKKIYRERLACFEVGMCWHLPF